MSRMTVRTRALIVLSLAFVPLQACSGGGDGPTGPSTPSATAPSISAAPQSVTVDEGAAASFSVTASGTAPLSYQWRRGGANVEGATASTYTLAAASATDDGARVSVVVSNSAGSATSPAATLSVRTRPVITEQPQSRSVASGVPAVFSVTATGTAVTYQWRRNGVDIPGATASTYAVGVPLAGDHGAVYSVVVTNALGAVTSADAALTVSSARGLRPTSYANAKAFNADPVSPPDQPWLLATATADFDGDGRADFFRATQVYGFDEGPENATKGEFQFWREEGGAWVRDAARLPDATGCVHPRKALVADFNGDQRPDVFMICHGYDQAPFPGEPARVVLSQPSGMYATHLVGQPGFYHGGTALDVNGDGFVDVVATNNFSQHAVFVFLNDGQGNFTLREDLIPIGSGNYFTAEAADVNGDGRADLLVGGHEWETGKTQVLINDGKGSFAAVTPVTLPAVPNEGVVLDFVVMDADRNGVNEIYVLRTSGGDGTFYQSRTVQRVTWPSLESTVLESKRGEQWIPFMNPVFDGGSYALVAGVDFVPFRLVLP